VVFSSVWAFGFTWGMLWAINKITPVRVDEAQENDGLDQSLHGEIAYLEDM
jgi:ammonium transporter, Amt family